MKRFRQIAAIFALILVLTFTIGWIAWLAAPGIRGAAYNSLLVFCGIFGVLMFIGIKMYKTPEERQAEMEKRIEVMRQAEERKTESKTENSESKTKQ